MLEQTKRMSSEFLLIYLRWSRRLSHRLRQKSTGSGSATLYRTGQSSNCSRKRRPFRIPKLKRPQQLPVENRCFAASGFFSSQSLLPVWSSLKKMLRILIQAKTIRIRKKLFLSSFATIIFTDLSIKMFQA